MIERQIDPTPSLTAAQSKAARALLGWGQIELARRAQIAVSTVADFERGKRNPVANNLDAMRSALEAGGISFPPNGTVAGPLPATSKPRGQRKGAPVRWINETQLIQWADSRKAQELLPELIRRLIIAENGMSAELRFASGDSIVMGGWDGVYKSDAAHSYIPKGVSGWEIGTDKNPKRKADADIEKRSADPGHLIAQDTTYIFVTPRRWADKQRWAEARKREGIWRDVRAIDAVDLVQWLEQFPDVALWLVHELKQVVFNVRRLTDFWLEWSVATKIPLSAELVLADREDEATKLSQWLKEDADVIGIQAESTEEAIAFLYAFLERLPRDHREYHQGRAIVVGDAATARALGDTASSLIIVLEEADAGLARALADKGHHVYLAIRSGVGVDNAVSLKRPTRYSIADELLNIVEQAYNNEPESNEKQRRLRTLRKEVEKYAQDTGRSLTILRRLIPSAPGYQPPAWASGDTARIMLATLLAGGWSERNESDKAIVARLANKPYDTYIEELTPLLSIPESPLRKIGSTWKIASPRDAWFLLAHNLVNSDIERFAGAAEDVLAAIDPSYELNPKERWMAATRNASPRYSEFLSGGISETLILLNVFGSRATGIQSASAKAKDIVQKLLKNASEERWFSISSHLQELAEASPDEFLKAVRDSLSSNSKPTIMSLFAEDDGFFGRSYHTNLLWALETLAWNAEYLPQITWILIKLSALDPGGKLVNRPINSFRQIYMLGYPQTFAPSTQRFEILDTMRRREPDATWNAMLALYPSNSGFFHDSPTPRWRDFPGELEPKTRTLVNKEFQLLGNWLIEDAGVNANRWKKLADRITDLEPDARTQFREKLLKLAKREFNDDERVQLQFSLRSTIHRNREFSDTNWALPEEEVDELEKLYHALSPKDDIKRITWLFESEMVNLLEPLGHDWNKNIEETNKLRDEAFKALLKSRGKRGILSLAAALPNRAELVGQSLVSTGSAALVDEIFLEALEFEDRTLVHGIMWTQLNRDKNWGEAILLRARKESWSNKVVSNIFLTLPKREPYVSAASTFGDEVERDFWQKAYFMTADDAIAAKVVERLIEFKRALHAVPIAGHNLKTIPNKLLVPLLQQAATEERPANTDSNSITMFQHYVEEIFQKLDKADDIEEDDIASLEWTYLSLLEHSRRPPRALQRRMLTKPEFFHEVLGIIYRPDKPEIKDEFADLDKEKRGNLANHAYRLLHTVRSVPGQEGQRVDASKLKDWIDSVRELCKKSGRSEIGDVKVGEILAQSPSESDGSWPAIAIRETIERCASKALEDGFYVGVKNKRGVTTRDPLDGGSLEREEAKKYRSHAQKVRTKWPRTADALEVIAESYDHEAKAHDDDVERRQF